jgi:hypothetical protein
VSERDRAFMRGQLASIGIFLPDSSEPNEARRPLATLPVRDDVDRDFVREALVRAGDPAQDIEWLIASCPSELDALGYRAPLPEAWCAVHKRPQPTDDHGCVLCRSIDIEEPMVKEQP